MSRTPRRPPVLEATPDALGKRGRAQVWASMLAEAQAEREKLDALQFANESGDDDPVPGLRPKEDDEGIIYKDGEPQFWSYGERKEHYDATVGRIWGQVQALDLADAVRDLLG